MKMLPLKRSPPAKMRPAQTLSKKAPSPTIQTQQHNLRKLKLRNQKPRKQKHQRLLSPNLSLSHRRILKRLPLFPPKRILTLLWPKPKKSVKRLSARPRKRPNVRQKRKLNAKPRKKPSVRQKRKLNAKPRKRPSVRQKRKLNARPRKRPSARQKRKLNARPRKKPSVRPRQAASRKAR